MRGFILILLLGFSISCARNEETPDPINPNSHIEYFGFLLIDTYWDDVTDNNNKTNYTDEISSFSNIADILVVSSSDNIANRIQAMNDVQVQPILHLSELFFELVDTNSASGANYDLRSDYEQRWDSFMVTNNLISFNDKIAAFYIGEEPSWNGISYEDLNAACNYVKMSMPEVPICIVEAYSAIADLEIPTSVDWIGFDHYFIKSPHSDLQYLQEIDLLKSKFSRPDQRLVIIMDSHYISWAHGDYAGIALSEMGEVAESYYTLAKAEPKTIAILGYFWPSGFDFPESIGARNMQPEVKNKYVEIGKEITGK